MEKQQAGKRSVALPIALVLLVFSLIGNVFLYSQSLQNKQQNNFEAGQRIIGKLAESLAYTREMTQAVDVLLQSGEQEADEEVLFRIGKASHEGHAIGYLLAETDKLTGEPGAFGAEEAEQWVDDKAARLMVIAAGNVNAGDELNALKASLAEMEQALSAFNDHIGDSRTAVIRLSGGYEWLDIAEQLRQMMSGSK